MQSIQITSGFIRPDGVQIQVHPSEMQDFCEDICHKYQQDPYYQSFSDKYHYFTPYYDFLVFGLHYISIGFLFDPNSYGTYYSLKKDPTYTNRLLIQPFPNVGKRKDIYSTLIKRNLKLEQERISIENRYAKRSMVRHHGFYLFPADDVSLGLSKEKVPFTNGFLMPDGSVFTLEKTKYHPVLSQTVLQHLMLEDHVIYQDFIKRSGTYTTDGMLRTSDYLYQCLGCAHLVDVPDAFMKFAIYDPCLLTQEQQTYLEQSSLDPTIMESIQMEFQNPNPREEVSALAHRVKCRSLYRK